MVSYAAACFRILEGMVAMFRGVNVSLIIELLLPIKLK